MYYNNRNSNSCIAEVTNNNDLKRNNIQIKMYLLLNILLIEILII